MEKKTRPDILGLHLKPQGYEEQEQDTKNQDINTFHLHVKRQFRPKKNYRSHYFHHHHLNRYRWDLWKSKSLARD